MNLTDKFIFEYLKGFKFDYVGKLFKRIFDVEIQIEIYEYSKKNSYRETAHVTFKKDKLIYQCDLCDNHDYENDFYQISIEEQRFICFRKTLYGFSLLNVDNLLVEYEYFPEHVIHGEESFIITDVKQLDAILIFDGCYWACPYGAFAFDYKTKRFLDLSRMCNVFDLDKTEVQGNNLIIFGTDENDSEKQVVISKQDIIKELTEHGNKYF